MTVARPMRIDLIKRALRDVFVDAMSGLAGGDDVPVVWANRNIPRKARPFVLLNITSGPSMVGTFVDEHRMREAPDDLTVTVDTALDGQEYYFRLNGLPVRYVATGVDTVDTIRDQFVTLLTTLNERVTVVATASPGEFTITPDTAGEVFSFEALPATFVTIVEGTKTSVMDTVGSRRLVVSCGFFAEESGKFEDDAHDLAIRCLTALSLPDTADSLHDQQVAIKPISDILNLSGVVAGGAKNESRATFDVDIHASSRITLPIGTIETVEGILDIDGTLIPFTVPAP